MKGAPVSNEARTRTGSRHDEGVTLVEVLIAIFVFTICIGGICRLGVSVRETSDRARSHYTAINIAKSRLERMKTFEFDQLAYFAESNVRVDANGSADTDGLFRRTTSLSAIKPNLTDIVVRVDIMDQVTRSFGRDHEEIRSYVADFLDIPDEA